MDFDLVVKGNIVTPSSVFGDGFLAVQGGRVAAVGGEDPRDLSRQFLDASGMWVLPGAVDAHVHSASCATHPEGWRRLSHCAAAGGVTTVLDMPYDAPEPITTPALLRHKISCLERESVVDVALYGTTSKLNGARQIEALLDAGVCAFKFSTYETDPLRFPRIPDDEILASLSAIGGRVPVVFHAENGEITNALVQQLRSVGEEDPKAHCRSRPAVAESVEVAKLLELARSTRAALHVAHLTVPHMFELIEQYRRWGVDATAETCIHYLLLSEEALQTQRGFAKCNPPLRSPEVRDGLWEQLAAERIAFVTTDHAPWPQDLKKSANIFDSKSGLPGLETFVPLFFDAAVRQRGVAIQEFARLISAAPAERFGLTSKGRLDVGRDADFFLLDPSCSFVVRSGNSRSVARHSPYDGWQVQGTIRGVWSRGIHVFDGQQVVAAEGHGRFVRPG